MEVEKKQGGSDIYKVKITLEPIGPVRTHILRIKVTSQEMARFDEEYEKGGTLIYPNAYIEDESDADILNIIKKKVTKKEYDEFDPEEANLIKRGKESRDENEDRSDEGDDSEEMEDETLQHAAQYIYNKIKSSKDNNKGKISYYIVEIEIRPELQESEFHLYLTKQDLEAFEKTFQRGTRVPMHDPIDKKENSTRIVDISIEKESDSKAEDRSYSYDHNGDLCEMILDYIFERMDDGHSEGDEKKDEDEDEDEDDSECEEKLKKKVKKH